MKVTDDMLDHWALKLIEEIDYDLYKEVLENPDDTNVFDNVRSRLEMIINVVKDG